MSYKPNPDSKAAALYFAIRDAAPDSIRSSQLAVMTGVHPRDHHSALESAIRQGAVLVCKVRDPGSKREQREWRLGAGVARADTLATLKPSKPTIVPVRDGGAVAVEIPKPPPALPPMGTSESKTHVHGAAVVKLPEPAPIDALERHVVALQEYLDEGQRLVIAHDSVGVVALGHHFRVNPDVPGALNSVLDAVAMLQDVAA